MPIGYSIPGVQLYVLDSSLRPTAPGVPGQLFVSGPQVAVGYLNRPEQTAAAFLPNPFSSKAGYGVMYATGDLVRCLPSNNEAGQCLEYLGRLDHQVKLRGFRIELQVRVWMASDIMTQRRSAPWGKYYVVLCNVSV